MHEVKHDGHRLIVLSDGRGSLKLLSRRGIDRTPLFRDPFGTLAESSRAAQSITASVPPCRSTSSATAGST